MDFYYKVHERVVSSGIFSFLISVKNRLFVTCERLEEIKSC